MFTKSREAQDHEANLRESFENLRKYNLRLNPNKCIFGCDDQRGEKGSGACLLCQTSHERSRNMVTLEGEVGVCQDSGSLEIEDHQINGPGL
ncbi:hypothetical protein LIER_37690 [Lithospermum erythrorhizon]|uniref:Reverse transcriptase domain-containing protein n=1 Tax=Lithospermum erythrorhizon TaxID=34254 RepID=A0AAV3PP65_LITER